MTVPRGTSDFTGRVAIVTGGGQGIGRAIATALLARGASVVLAEIDSAAGRQAAADLAALGPVALVATDVAEEASVVAMVAAALARFGRIDALVNNAATRAPAALEELSLAAWNRVIAVNLTGVFLTAKHAAPHLSAAAAGAIVNIASTRALQSEAGTEAYSASKGGVVALTHALSLSLGPAIRVNCISPGWIEVGDRRHGERRASPSHSEADRAQHPVGRVGVPEDVASLACYLLGPEAGFITGANFVVDGGMTRKMIYV
ncbi:MAG: glucose 1-dehydrogenase [Alphaproteobacteria bacterium]|nr:glucose 1-dehydrogenase [Alphaproteobacteria bacterium]